MNQQDAQRLARSLAQAIDMLIEHSVNEDELRLHAFDIARDMVAYYWQREKMGSPLANDLLTDAMAVYQEGIKGSRLHDGRSS